MYDDILNPKKHKIKPGVYISYMCLNDGAEDTQMGKCQHFESSDLDKEICKFYQEPYCVKKHQPYKRI